MSGDAEPEKKIIVDSDWKDQVQQEKEKLRSQEAAEPSPATDDAPASSPEPPGESSLAGQLPPPDFRMLVSMLATQAFAALGQIPDPQSGQPRVELPLAKHMIDLLAVIETKTQGNLSTEEAQLLEHALHDLRMAYVAMSQQQ